MGRVFPEPLGFLENWYVDPHSSAPEDGVWEYHVDGDDEWVLECYVSDFERYISLILMHAGKRVTHVMLDAVESARFVDGVLRIRRDETVVNVGVRPRPSISANMSQLRMDV